MVSDKASETEDSLIVTDNLNKIPYVLAAAFRITHRLSSKLQHISPYNILFIVAIIKE